MKPVTYPGTLYDYHAGSLVGVLVTEKVMRKLAQAQARHLEQVKRILTDAGEEQVFPASWTLHYPNGKQTTVRFIDTNSDLEKRIRWGTHTNPPEAVFPVFIAGSMKEAEQMADERARIQGATV